MRHILALTFAAALLGSPAHAQSNDGVPAGWVKVDGVKKIQVWAPDKKTLTPTGRTEFLAKLREIYDVLEDIYILDRTVVNAAGAGSKFPEKQRTRIDMLLFANDVEYDKWLLEEGKSLATIHEGRYFSVVGFPLIDGALPKERWPDLWQICSLVFIHHHFYFDPPLWLNEGLAIYFSYSTRKNKPTEFKSFTDMMASLQKAKDDGAVPGVMKLLEQRTEMSRAEREACWVLVHMLMTQAKNIFSDMTSAMKGLEEGGYEGEKQIINDIHRACVHVLKQAWQGEKGLQAAFEEHWKNLLRSPTMPGKLSTPPVAVASVAKCLDLSATAVMQAESKPPWVRFSGGVRPCFDWGGRLSVNASVGKPGKWTDPQGITEGNINEKGATLKWDKVRLPASNDQVRIELWWAPDSGAVYRFYRHWNIESR